METIIDIGLVKEQLRLLGHEVADDVILEFVKGLNRGPAGQQQEKSAATSSSNVGTAVVDSRQPGDSDAAVSSIREAKQQGGAATAVRTQQQNFPWRGHTDSDAAPSKLQQAPDQQSPKRIAAGAGGIAVQELHSPPAASMLQRAALDQRCRNFLARCSEKPSPQHLMHSKDQQQQQQHRPQQALLLQVPRPQQQHGQPAAAGSSDLLSTSGSSELLLDEAAAGDSPDDADSVASVDAQPYAARRVLPAPPAQELPASNSWGQQQSQQQLLQAQLHAELAEEGGSSSDSDGSSTALEAEGSKFLMHQAATMQRVRARLAAKMAGYTAAAASSSQPHQAPQPAAGAVDVPAAAQPATGARAAAAAAIARLKMDAASRSGAGTALPTTINSDNQLPQVAAEVADASSSELPRFGFRPGYKPLGVHMPPPPSTAAVEALAASRALRQQAPAGAGAATALGMMGTAGLAAAAQHRLDMPLCMHSLTSALQQHQQQQQQWQVQSRPEPVVVPVGVSACSSGGHLGGSPGKPAGAGAVCRSSGSIIGGETPPCKVAAGGKSRQSPRVDPLYLAPSSPRRSNPATPRSSPARSPAPVAPLSAAAVNLGLVRSPAGTAPAAAVTVPAGRGSSKQGLSFSAGSKGMQGRSGAQLQQASAVGMRRASSAPATPAAAAPPASVRSSGAGFGSSSAGGGGTGGSSSYSSRSRSAASHESLYCQRLAYSNQRSAVAPGVRKTDRVARFQQMQQQWQRDRFLCSGAGGAAAKKASGQHNHG